MAVSKSLEARRAAKLSSPRANGDSPPPIGPGRRLPSERALGSLERRKSRAQKFADSSPTMKTRGVMVKFLFLGDSETGKSAIVSRYINGQFDSAYNPTVAVDFAQTNVMVGEQRLRLALWQVSEKKEGTIATNTFRGLHGAFITADIARQDTFHGVAKYRQLLDDKLSEVGGGNVPVVLLANKSDRLGEEGVSLNKGSMDKLCKRHRLNAWYATSAKEDANIDLAIKEVLRQAVKSGIKGDFKDIPQSDIEALHVEVEGLNGQGTETERSPGHQVLRDHQWFETQAHMHRKGCGCVIS